MIKSILITWCAVVVLIVIAILMPTKKIVNKVEVKKEIKDTCNACAIHRIYELKNATPHYEKSRDN